MSNRESVVRMNVLQPHITLQMKFTNMKLSHRSQLQDYTLESICMKIKKHAKVIIVQEIRLVVTGTYLPFPHLANYKYRACLHHHHPHRMSRALFLSAYGAGKLQRGLSAWTKLDRDQRKPQAWIHILIAGRSSAKDDYCPREVFTMHYQERFCSYACS